MSVHLVTYVCAGMRLCVCMQAFGYNYVCSGGSLNGYKLLCLFLYHVACKNQRNDFCLSIKPWTLLERNMCLHFLTHRQKKRACVCARVCAQRERESEWAFELKTFTFQTNTPKSRIFFLLLKTLCSFLLIHMTLLSISMTVCQCEQCCFYEMFKLTGSLEEYMLWTHQNGVGGGGGGGGGGRKKKKRHWSAPKPKFHPWNSKSNVMCVRAGEQESVNIETCVNWH